MTLLPRALSLAAARGSLLAAVVVSVGLAPLTATAGPSGASQPGAGWIEPQAGSWQTWVLASGNQLRPAAPPDAAGTAAEIDLLQQLAAQRSPEASDVIAFWDTGSPSYRWNELAISEALKHNSNSLFGYRTLALLHVALTDAMISTWDAKYAYKRLRPSEFNPALTTALPNPPSPAYPSEYGAAAGAASAVLAYLFPDDAPLFATRADQALSSRLLAGVEYPSDIAAGR